jgi:hypothetical protein
MSRHSSSQYNNINNNNNNINNQIPSTELDYEQLAIDVFNEQNRVRTEPQSYIEKLERATTFFKDKIFRHPAEIPIETYEGIEGVTKAIKFLKEQQPVPELKYSKELSQACKDHCIDIGSKGLSSHEGSDGNGISERIEKYIEWDGAIAENLDFCYKFAENIIMNLIIDDGSKEKHQRSNLFNPEFVYAGVACDKHKTFKVCTVINYAKGLHEIGEEPPDIINSVQDYIEKTMGKENKPKNAFQNDDPDAPDNTISMKIVKLTKNIKGEDRNITRKIYILSDGKQHMVEIEDRE